MSRWGTGGKEQKLDPGTHQKLMGAADQTCEPLGEAPVCPNSTLVLLQAAVGLAGHVYNPAWC